MIWGMHHGGWMSGLYSKAANPQLALLELLVEFGLSGTGFGAKGLLADDAQRNTLATYAREHHMHINLGLGGDFLTCTDDEAKALADEQIAALKALQPEFNPLVCTAGINRNYHHYSRDIPVAEQIKILSRRMKPLASACAEAGAPLCIHTVTHFAEDYAELCRQTPGLGLYFDTANCYLIGEVPLDAAKINAPYTYICDFKDHYAWPEFKPLGLRVRGAVPGEGDVQLTKIFDILKKQSPAGDRLNMQFEIDPVADAQGNPQNQRDVLQKAVAYRKQLEAR